MSQSTTDQISNITTIPQEYICSITQEIMKDPMSAPDGNTYEKSAIIEWLNKNPISPITREPMDQSALVTNRNLKGMIERFVAENKNIIRQISKSSMESEYQQIIPRIDFDLQYSIKDNTMKLSIKPADDNIRIPSHVVLGIDTSGSMCTNAETKDSNGVVESSNLSMLDIVKHAAKTLIMTLKETDYVSIVSYSSVARTHIKLLKMTEANQKLAITELDKLDTNGQTNLWDGLKHCLDCVSEGNHKIKNSSIFILTDGQPNIIPPRGHVESLNKYKDKHDINCSINTYGFGYNLDSKDLNNIAKSGGGSYHFIPDPGMVGTTFVNTQSNLLTTFTPNVTVQVEIGKNVYLKSGGIHEQYEFLETSWGYEFNVGGLRYGQSRDLLFDIDTTKNDLDITFHIKSSFINLDKSITYNPSLNIDKTFTKNECRLKLVETIQNILDDSSIRSNDITQAKNHAKSLDTYLNTVLSNTRDSNIQSYIKDLIIDTKQIIEATNDYSAFNRWGKHYLPSLMNAHLNQECNNFKDPGIQHYGGQSFGTLRDEGDEIFIALPPPQPKIDNRYSNQGYRGGYRGRTPVTNRVDMSSYYNSASGCIAGWCLVTMADGNKKPIQDIMKGDKIKTAGSDIKVKCVIKTKCDNNQIKLVKYTDKLYITEYHPILGFSRYANEPKPWIFPCSLKRGKVVNCDAVYNLVLDNGHIIEIDGIYCVTLGHGLEEHVVKHEYFGTEKVIKDLEKIDGYSDGFIEIEQSNYIRDETNKVCGIQIRPNQKTKKNIILDKESFSKYNFQNLNSDDIRVIDNIMYNGVGELFCA